SPEAYFQEAGRAGRDGKRAYAVLLYNEATLTALKKRIVQSFPEKKYIREVYRDLGNFFGLGEGIGAGLAFEFDPDAFVKAFNLEYVRALSAIDVLQVAGYLECTTDVHARSRISFLVLRDQLYKIEFNDILTERLVEFILRNYAGVFVQYAYVDENELAEHLGTTRDSIYHALLGLAKRHVISYIPGNDRPYIVYHQPRVPSSYVHLDRNSYENRKETYARKIEKMAAYIETEDTCRQLYLMEYFGQKEKEPCGVCDLCIGKKKRLKTADKKSTDEKILSLLKESDKEVKELIYLTGEDREWVIDRIRCLLEEKKIIYKSPVMLGLNF
ncbi:MAG: RecQ family zinc-binding domain-containing protein, partial [Odoribacter sp.]|nr:RecQ family zinc-binding domain-containing protein [Odoribacter sp.]